MEILSPYGLHAFAKPKTRFVESTRLTWDRGEALGNERRGVFHLRPRMNGTPSLMECHLEA